MLVSGFDTVCRKDVLKQWKMFGHIVGAQDLCDSLSKTSVELFLLMVPLECGRKGEPAVQFKGRLPQRKLGNGAAFLCR